MSEASLEGATPAGRPSAGAVLAEALASRPSAASAAADLAAEGRSGPMSAPTRGRDLAGLFLLVSTGATLASAPRRGWWSTGASAPTPRGAEPHFLIAAAVVAVLAAATAPALLFHHQARRAGGRRPAQGALRPRADASTRPSS